MWWTLPSDRSATRWVPRISTLWFVGACSSSPLPPLGFYEPAAVQYISVAPSKTAGTGESLSDLVGGQERLHLVTVPTANARSGEVFVFLPGTGANPQSFNWLANFAAFHGTPSIALAYANGDSARDDCDLGGVPGCQGDDPYCEEGVRQEALYGRSTFDSACIDVPDEEAILHRTLRIVQWLDRSFPREGFGVALTADGERLRFDRLAIGGWSQGGGHASMIARDHELARGIYLSKASGAITCAATLPEQQAYWGCDPSLSDESSDWDELRQVAVPTPWALDPRATPPWREHGAIHLYEEAAFYSFQTFVEFGIVDGPEEAFLVDPYEGYDTEDGALDDASLVVTTALAACGTGAFHRSMASDRCMAKRGDGLPVLADAYTSFFAPFGADEGSGSR